MLYISRVETQSIITNISRYVTLTEEEQHYFSSILLPLSVKQGELIERVGEVSRYFIHVRSGCLMTYFTDLEGKEHVAQFATANWWTGDLNSFTQQKKSNYSTRALADSEVLLLPKREMEELLNQHPVFERYFRIIFQNSIITHQNRIMDNFAFTAEERYQHFQEKYPALEQYVPQKYIASYLGITPEFLSKIRRKMAER